MNKQVATSILVVFIIVWWFIAYLIGNCLFGVLIARLKKVNLHKVGSTNVGSTNVSRSLGIGYGLIVLFLDMLKSYVAIIVGFCFVYLIMKHTNNSYSEIVRFLIGTSIYLSGFFTILGHCYPLKYLRYIKKQKDLANQYRGGKGVACFAGIVIAFSPWLLLVAILVFAIVFFSSKYVSLSSILTSWIAPAFILLFVYLFKHYNVPLFLYLFEIFICKLNKNSSNLDYLGLFTHVVFILSAIIILIRHKQNIINIQNHVEKKFTFKSKKS